MVEVILRCPTQYSGLETHELFNCINEDLYFSNVLYGLNATMPTAFEASLFSVKTLFPEQTVEYNSIEKSEIVATIQMLWNDSTGILC
jgi:hypothetical protein